MQPTAPITYSLTADGAGAFYAQLSRFTDAVLRERKADVLQVIGDFHAFIVRSSCETARSLDEYYVEFLAIGLFDWYYGGHARHAQTWLVKTLTTLFRLRRRYVRLKPSIDIFRGRLMGGLLSRDFQPAYSSTAHEFTRLCRWLEAAGDFKEEVERLCNWQAYFATLPDERVSEILASAHRHAQAFRRQAAEALGRYTANVSAFLREVHPGYSRREDNIFCGRSEAEYHLNMVGAEILNRALSPAFHDKRKKVVLLPTCMCQPTDGKCRAVHQGLEISCVGCSAACHANIIRMQLQQQGVGMYLIPHSSSFTRFLERWKSHTDVGLVGVACVLNLLTGGYEMLKLQIASQCVFLDYCGCRKHWHEDGIPTNLDARQLLKVVAGTGDGNE